MTWKEKTDGLRRFRIEMLETWILRRLYISGPLIFIMYHEVEQIGYCQEKPCTFEPEMVESS
jgi:hypothetical protein